MIRTLLVLSLTFLPARAEDIFGAIRAGNYQAVLRVLKAEPGVLETRNSVDLTPLMAATITSDAKMMQLLIDQGADVNVANENGLTALHCAAYDLPKTKLLLERKANVNVRTTNGYTPLSVAAQRKGALPLVKLLLDHGADVNASASTPAGPQGALTSAAAAGDLSVIQLLLARGARIKDNPGILPYAVISDCVDCVELLLKSGLRRASA